MEMFSSYTSLNLSFSSGLNRWWDKFRKSFKNYYTLVYNWLYSLNERLPRLPFSYHYRRAEARKYLGSTWLINCKHDLVKNTSAYLIQEDKYDTIMTITSWINRYMEPDSSIGCYPPSQRSADQILKRKRGVCADYAVLEVALLRAANIPARLLEGWLWDDTENAWFYHAWVQVYYWGRWRMLDPTHGSLWNKALFTESPWHLSRYKNWEVAEEETGDVFSWTSGEPVKPITIPPPYPED